VVTIHSLSPYPMVKLLIPYNIPFSYNTSITDRRQTKHRTQGWT